MENLIFGAFATLEGHREGDAANLGSDAYYRCIVVALASAKLANPDCDVALVTNAPVPRPYAAQLEAAGVQVLDCPFDHYRVDAALEWSLAFYKLCAMEWVLAHTAYARCALLDVDTYTQYPYTDLWREADEAVLLYQVPHAANQPMAAAISRNYARLYGGQPVADPLWRRADRRQPRPPGRLYGRVRRGLPHHERKGPAPPRGRRVHHLRRGLPQPAGGQAGAGGQRLYLPLLGGGAVLLCPPPTTATTRCVSSTCRAAKTASCGCCTGGMQSAGLSPRGKRSTACAASPPRTRRCCAASGCGCWPGWGKRPAAAWRRG